MLRIRMTPPPFPKDPNATPAPPPLDTGGAPDLMAPPLPPEETGQGADGDVEPDGDEGPRFDMDKVDPGIAGYQGPEEGPFECEHCSHFTSPNACQIVSGPIDPEGCCNLYSKGGEADEVEPDNDEQAEASSEPDENQELAGA